jgi:hypothetical protein
MRVKDLIEDLQKLPQDAEIISFSYSSMEYYIPKFVGVSCVFYKEMPHSVFQSSEQAIRQFPELKTKLPIKSILLG